MKKTKAKITRCIAAIFAVSAMLQMPIFVSAEEKTGSAPTVSAKSAVLIEADSTQAVFEKNADERLPMASTTKIMTAIVALENSDLDSTVEVAPQAAGVEGSSIYLKASEQILMSDLVYALMLESANDAAAAIACEVSGSIEEFASLMNKTAAKIGLENTHFMNPHGLDDPEHYTTARDLACLASYALKNPEFRKIVSTYKKTIPMDGDEGTRLLLNHNKLLKLYDSAFGVKTGFTKKSGRCLVSAAERDGVTMIAVTLNAPDDWNDHISMLDYGFEKYERVSLAEEGEVFTELPCIGGETSSVRCSNRDKLEMSLPRDTRVVTRIEADRYFPAPVKSGDALARAVFYVDGCEIASLPLYAENDVAESTKKLGFFEKIMIFLGR